MLDCIIDRWQKDNIAYWPAVSVPMKPCKSIITNSDVL
jgi:hypothetical protein